jgi:hypothetical protein
MFTTSHLDGSLSLAAAPLADGVVIVKMPGKGRGMIAARDFHPGDIIVQEAPFATAVDRDAMEATCSGTMTSFHGESAALKRCGGCKSLRSACASLPTSIAACDHSSELTCVSLNRQMC